MEGKGWDERMQWPMILGHEGAGIVESVGEGVKDFKAGTEVLFHLLPTPKILKYLSV